MSDHLEIERKFHIDPDVAVPDLGEGVRLGASTTHQLDAVYLDTPDLALARARTTLRRRTGGDDAGWHLKLPARDGARVERHAPLDAGSTGRVPATLRAEVTDVVGAAPLVPVATLSTTRVETNLLVGGRIAALLADDTVTVQPGGLTWRELEIELVGDADPALLDRLTERLAIAGVGLSDSPSKLSRALGERVADAAARDEAAPGNAGEVVMAYVATQVGVIQSREQDVRDDAPDAVHKTRVATRRLRSALRTFRPLFEEGSTEGLRDDVRRLGEVLGGPRDAEVQKERLLAALADLPDDLRAGPVDERVAAELDRRHDEARAALVEALDGDEHAALLDRLAAFVADPPLVRDADRKAAKVLPPLVRSAVRRTDKAAARARSASGHERLVELHETRKKAKAARYACEAVAPAFGKDATRLLGAYEQVTEALGHVQDAVVGVEQLRDLALVAEAHGEPGFAYGALAANQLHEGHAAELDGLAALDATHGRRLRGWLG